METKKSVKSFPARRNGIYYLDEQIIKKTMVTLSKLAPEGWKWQGDYKKKREYPSSTTILGASAKPYLVSWAARETAKAALADPTLSHQEAASIIYKKRDKAGNLGTTIHSWAEAF